MKRGEGRGGAKQEGSPRATAPTRNDRLDWKRTGGGPNNEGGRSKWPGAILREKILDFNSLCAAGWKKSPLKKGNVGEKGLPRKGVVSSGWRHKKKRVWPWGQQKKVVTQVTPKNTKGGPNGGQAVFTVQRSDGGRMRPMEQEGEKGEN